MIIFFRDLPVNVFPLSHFCASFRVAFGSSSADFPILQIASLGNTGQARIPCAVFLDVTIVWVKLNQVTRLSRLWQNAQFLLHLTCRGFYAGSTCGNGYSPRHRSAASNERPNRRGQTDRRSRVGTVTSPGVTRIEGHPLAAQTGGA